MAGGGRRRRAAAEARLKSAGSAGSVHEMAMMNSGMLGGGMSFAQGEGNLADALQQQNSRDAKLGKSAGEENLSPFDPRAWFTEMTRYLLFLIFFNVTIFSGKQGQDIFDCECEEKKCPRSVVF